MSQQRLVIITDHNNNPVDLLDKITVYKKGLPHRLSRLMIINHHDEILIQHRSKTVAHWPQFLDSSVAGVVEANESYFDTLSREAVEEIDFKLPSLQPAATYKTLTYHPAYQTWLPRFEALYIYRTVHPLALTPDQTEVERLEWIHRDKLIAIKNNQISHMTTGLIESLSYCHNKSVA